MLVGHSRNTLTAACFPQGADILRLHDGGCRWALLNPSRGFYNWPRLDAHLAASEAKGIPSMYVFSSTPAWTALPVAGAPPGFVDATSNHPPNLQDWTDFVSALVNHVKRADGTLRIKYWEMWNEANSLGFWCGTNVQLLAMAQALYWIVKAADPTAMVTTPTPCWDATDAATAIATYHSLGFHNFADIVSFHGYLPDGAPAANIGPMLDKIQAVTLQYKSARPLWDTEFGFKSPTLVPDSQKAQWVRDAITVRLQKGIAAAIWYQWDNQTHGPMTSLAGVVNVAGQAWANAYNTLHHLPAVTGIVQVK